MVNRLEKVFSLNTVVDRNTCTSVFKINNSFAMKNDKISHFKKFQTHKLNNLISRKWKLNGQGRVIVQKRNSY